jgi:hypothetical protein
VIPSAVGTDDYTCNPSDFEDIDNLTVVAIDPPSL